jgi:hypothetical protein
MSSLDTPYAWLREQRRACLRCGTEIPASDPILQKLKRCHHCGKRHPFGIGRKNLLGPLVVIAAMAALTIWWGHPPL